VKRAFVMAACAVLAGCVPDNPLQPGRGRVAAPHGPAFTLNPACDPGLGGQTHLEDSIKTPVTWTRANNPHRVEAPLFVSGAGRLTLEPGVVVCFGEYVYLGMVNGGSLIADGLDTARIVLTAGDPDGWTGMFFGGHPAAASRLKNVVMEGVDGWAVSSADSAAVTIDSSVFRHPGAGLYLAGRGSSISRSLVDSTTIAEYPAVVLGTLARFEDTQIRGAAGVGLMVVGTNGVSLLGGRIEGSRGVGLVVTTTGAGIVATRPIRVVGGASYPAELVVSAFPRIYPALSDQDSLLGNARDTLVVTGGILQSFAYPKAALPWRITGNIVVQYFGILNPKPGAALVFDYFVWITARNGGRVVARGTAAAPVVFTGDAGAGGWNGILLEGSPSLPSYLTNVRIENVTNSWAVWSWNDHTVVIDSAVFRQNGVAAWLWSSNSRISRSRVDTTLIAEAAVELSGANAMMESTLIRASAGDGLSIANNTNRVLSCEIRESAGSGIVGAGTVDVHNCNLVNNGGVGISSPYATVNAEDNWWGDTGGPTGPNGDGVSGPVNYTPWRTTPFVLPYVP